ncbi:MAG: acyltransferase family protein [Rhodoglobus sp.]
MSSTSENGPAPRVVRTDVQALRAIAVVLVILDHLVLLQKLPGHPEGGFIGVDVFFVISGFLITGHLIREIATSGRVSFKDFYLRRARRILPMALLVIAVTIGASYLVFWPWLASQYSVDGLWSALFVSNIAFAIRGVDYFSTDQTSVFQHYWSLSVEEQFYLVWPIVIALTGLIAFRRAKPMRWLLGAAIVVGAASFVWATIDTSASPAAAYFSTFARGFEFAIGGILAILAPSLSRIPDRLRPWLSAVGVVGILASIYIIDPKDGFPGPMGLLPTVAAGLFIAAGTGANRQIQIWPLRARAVTYVGNISYSLYLWHWPIILILTALVPREIVVVPAAIGLTVGLSVLSYHFVEQPILRSSWLLPKTKPTRALPRRVIRNVSVMSAGVLVAAILVAGGDATVRALTSDSSEPSTAVALSMQAEQPEAARALVDELQDGISAGLVRDSWYGLEPDVSEIATYGGALATECWTEADEDPRTCLRGDPSAPNTVVVLGDSIAMNAAFAVDAFVEENPDWNLQVFAKLGCSAQRVPALTPGGAPYTKCDEFRDWSIEQIRKINPDAIWLTSALPRTIPGVAASDITDVWSDGLRETLTALKEFNVYVVMPPPAGEDLSFCSRPYNTPRDCGSRIDPRWLEIRDSSDAVSTESGALLVDTSMWFCDPTGSCPAVIGDYIVRRDERHLTYAFGASLSPLVKAWLTE